MDSLDKSLDRYASTKWAFISMGNELWVTAKGKAEGEGLSSLRLRILEEIVQKWLIVS